MCYDVSVKDGDDVRDPGSMCKYEGVKWLSPQAL